MKVIGAGLVACALLGALAIAAEPQWQSAQPGRPIVLPADHASHPDYKLEWWYYTGNLDARDGRRYGYQLTFFRVGVTSSASAASTWAVRDLFMAHLAVTDVRGRTYRFAERLNRAGPAWAGASVSKYRVWNDNWEASLDTASRHRLKAASGAIGVDLLLEERRPPVLHGERGYSRKGSADGNASHYYSLTRMPTSGAVVVDGERVEVTGLSWMDHEFGTTFLESGQQGWDWLAMHLDDGRDLMLYRFRRADGSIDEHSSGTIVSADGSARNIAGAAFSTEPGRTWTSPVTRARYPVEWRIRVPGEQLDLRVSTPLDNQELHSQGSAGVNYWEGAIDVAGTSGGRPIGGRGYLEMTGYSGRAMSDVLR